MSNKITVVLVEFNDSSLHPTKTNPHGKYFAFGSVEAIFTVFNLVDIGLKPETMRKHLRQNENVCIAKKCTIRKIEVHKKNRNIK